MNQKLSRVAVAFAFMLIFTAMIGIVAVGLLTAAENQLSPIERTVTSIVAGNKTVAAQLEGTETAAPSKTLTTTPSAPYEPTGQQTEEQLTPCAFMWAQQTLPDVAEQARKVFDEVDLTNIEVRGVSAYGENCFEPDGTVRYFAAMTTDFYLAAEVDKLEEETLGQLVEETYTALITIPRDDLPARPGYLDFVFTAGAKEERLRVMFDQVKAELDAGQRGAALWAALNP